MCYSADETYRKDRLHAPGFGYGRQLTETAWTAARNARPTAIVVHATHGHTGSTAAAEAKYLRDSPVVSAHYLIGRDGILYRLLPDETMAWHAGRVLAGFQNERSIGVELHASTVEPILEIQKTILGSLCHALIAEFHIVKALINTHKAVALPLKRKTDPFTWDQADFLAWRDRLYEPA